MAVAKKHLTLQWVRNRADVRPNGDVVSGGATLGEWHHFVETMRELIQTEVTKGGADASPRGSPRTGRAKKSPAPSPKPPRKHMTEECQIA